MKPNPKKGKPAAPNRVLAPASLAKINELFPHSDEAEFCELIALLAALPQLSETLSPVTEADRLSSQCAGSAKLAINVLRGSVYRGIKAAIAECL